MSGLLEGVFGADGCVVGRSRRPGSGSLVVPRYLPLCDRPSHRHHRRLSRSCGPAGDRQRSADALLSWGEVAIYFAVAVILVVGAPLLVGPR